MAVAWLLTFAFITVQAQTPPNNAEDCGQALAFDGADDYITTDINLKNKSFTLEAWAKLNATSGTYYIFGGGTASSHNGLHAGYLAGSNAIRFSFYGNDLDASITPDTDWHHLAFTFFYDATQANIVRKIYLDGVEIASQSNVTPYASDSTLRIGRGYDGNYFAGLLDEVKVWNRPLTAGEVPQSAAGTHPADASTALTTHYDFNNQINVTTLDDVTANGNNGNLTNMDPATNWVNADGSLAALTWYADADGDEYAERIVSCDDLSSTHTTDIGTLSLISTTQFDCDDNDSAVNPGATEIFLDGVDNDCNPATADNAITATYTDGDILALHSSPNSNPTTPCGGYVTVAVPPGLMITTVDVQYNINDRGSAPSSVNSLLECSTNGEREPIATGVGDFSRTGLTIAEGLVGMTTFKMNLWYPISIDANQCSDKRAIIPNNTLSVSAYLEQDARWYPDADGDNYVSNNPVESEDDLSSEGYYLGTNLPNGGLFDCDDTNPAAHEVLIWYADTDSDGHMMEVGESCGAPDDGGTYYSDPETEYANFIGFDDCDDTNPAVHEVLIWYADTDSDGYMVEVGESCGAPDDGGAYYADPETEYANFIGFDDCDDDDININPGAPEVHGDGLDNDCNPATADGPGNSLHFDGSNDYVSATGPNLTSKSFSIEFWAKRTEIGVYGMVFFMGSNAGGKGLNIPILDNNKVRFSFYASDFDSNTPITDTDWHHYAMTYDQSNRAYAIYIDGSEDKSGTFPFDFTGSTALLIGRQLDNQNRFFKGNLDELRIWNKALTEAEINASKDCELTGSETGLLAYYNFNQGMDGVDNSTETTLTDATGNGHNGTLTNFSLNSTSSNWVSGSQIMTGTLCNKAPVLGTIGSQSVILGETLTFTASATDDDSPTLTYGLDATSESEGMILNTSTGEFSWTPIVDQLGAHSVTVSVSDGLDSDSETFTITVNKVLQTITFDPLSAVTYGDAAFNLTATASSGLTVTYLGSDESVATVSGSTVTIVGTGTTTITASQAGDGSYLPAEDVTQDLTVNKATLTINADDQSRAYGATNPSFTVSYDGFVNGDDASDIDTPPTASTVATATNDAGTYAITASGGSDNNYEFSYLEGTLTVTKAMLTATAEDQSRTYGATNPSFTVSYDGFVNGDDASDLDTPPTASTAATVTSGAGTYAITASGGSDNNYEFSYLEGALTVTKAMLTATADDQSRAYGATNPSFTVSYDGFVNGDVQSALDTPPVAGTTATSSSDAGTYAITVAGGTDDNYTFSYVEGTLTVNPAVLTVTADNQTIIYGDVFPTFTFSYSGFANGEDESVLDSAPAAETTATGSEGSDAGTYPITLTGGSDDNYDLTLVSGTLTIEKAGQSITFDAIDDIDLLTTSSVTLNATSDTGLPIDFSLTQGTGTITGTTLTVSETGTFTVEASQTGNVNYHSATASRAFNVTDSRKDNQTITFGPLETKTYGDASFNLDASANSGLAVTYLSSNTSVATVAGSTVTIVGAGTTTITASQSGDTDFNPAPVVLQDLVVDKATLTATADGQDKTYGSANPALTVTYTGFVNGDAAADLNTAPAATTTATVSSDAGIYEITVTGGVDDNYTFSYVNGTLTVNPAVLTVTADGRSKTYGSANPALTYVIEGYVNGDDESVIATMPTANTTATEASDAGSYAITISGGVADNYSFNYEEGTLTITPVALIAIADDQSRAYGAANPSLTVSYTGFMNGDSESDLDMAPAGNTTAMVSSDAGSYAITVSGGNDNNYTFTYGEGTLTVSQAALTVAADDQSIVYGDALPALTMSYTGFVNGDNEAVLDAAPAAGTTATGSGVSDAGDYPITLSGGSDNNYTFTYVEGTLIINKAAQTITVDPIADRDVSDDPFAIQASTTSGLALSYKITGPATISGSTITLTGATGTVEVTISQSGNQNYHSATPVTESFLVTDATKQNQTITFDEISDKAYGNIFTLTATASSGLAVSYTLISGPATLSGAEVTITGVGEVAVSASQAGDATFNPAFPVAQSFMAGQANLMVTADDQQINYGEEVPALTISYSGFVSGDTEADLSAVPEASVSATSESDAGTYEIIVSGGSATNYTFTYQPGTLTINKATAQIAITNLEQEADGSAKEPTVVTDPADLNYTITYDGNGGAPTQAGSYEVVVTITETNYAGTATATFVLTGEEVLGVSPDEQVTIYPNPAEHIMEVSSAGDERIRVYDLNGVLQLEGKANTKIAIGQLRSGVYMVELSDRSGKSYLRLIKR